MGKAAAFIRHHRVASGIFAAVFLALVALAVYSAANAPGSSAVQVTQCVQTGGGDCIRFPVVTGTNLLGTAFTLPVDFTGELNLVVVSFDEGQTLRAESWLPLARELAAAYPQLAYYSLPTLPSVNPLLRGIISGGMLVAIPDEHLRAITIMLFLEDIDSFLTALTIENKDAIQVFLLNARGVVLWRASGEYSAEIGGTLRGSITSLSEP